MELLSVEIENFRQFYGNNKVVFARDSQKNITLIHAENGVGKTAFLNAILWCLYEKTTENFEHSDVLLNHARKVEGVNNYHVFVEFVYEGAVYVAQRHCNRLTYKTFRVLKVMENGNHVPIDGPEFFINSIIPREMARYFFFQGEGAGSFTNNKSGNVREAIRNILGFTIAEKALSDLSKIKLEFRKELQRIDKTSALGAIQEKIGRAEEEVNKLQQELDAALEDQNEVSKKLKAVDQEYRESNIEVIRAKQSARDSKQKELARAEQALQRSYEKKADLITDFAVSIFAKKIADEGIDFIDEKELKGTIPAPYNEQLVKDILESTKCICGNDVVQGTEAYNKIHKLIAKAADPILQNRVSRARSQLTAIRKDLTICERQFDLMQKEFNSSASTIQTLKGELGELSVSIKDVDNDEIQKKEHQRENFTIQLRETNRRVGSLEERLKSANSLLSKLKADESRFGVATGAIQNCKKRIDFIASLEDKLNEILQSTEESSKLTLMTKVNALLKRYVRQDYIAKMNENYDIVLIDSMGNKVGKSDGQSLLLSLTFISSLISIAKDRLGAKGDVLLPGATAPFVIDAPFGVLDNEYKSNIAREIPKAVQQVVLLLSSSHWSGQVEEVIRERVGAEYNMKLHVAAGEKTDVISSIEILGKEYPTVIYDAERDMTTIEEVGRYE